MKRECPRNAVSAGAPAHAASAPGKSHFKDQLATEAQGMKEVDDAFEAVIAGIMGSESNFDNGFLLFPN